jgi:hypothetical protein
LMFRAGNKAHAISNDIEHQQQIKQLRPACGN